MKELPKILTIIVTWNKQSYVIDLLNSLKNLNYPDEKVDIVVVDNASSDDTVQILKEQFSHIHLIENKKNLGGTGGFNTGLEYAFSQSEGKYDHLWLLDNDVVVHPNALAELVDTLESEKDIAIAGSTMMQLNTPWRINEMGSYVDLGRGTLLLNRHREDVTDLKGSSIEELQKFDLDLSKYLQHCNAYMDVEYVAAASLVIRSEVAKKAGLWDDYFIHFDDVEWCLRIAKMGHRIVVSAKSVIWHLSAEYKVPSWVLYYDNRNVLYMLEKHSAMGAVKGSKKWIKKKSLYYELLGKRDLAALHQDALLDYENRIMGKNDIQLDECYYPLTHIDQMLHEADIKRILIPWTVNLQSTNLQKSIVRALKSRPELQVDYVVPPKLSKKTLIRQIPGAGVIHVKANKIRRILDYLKLRNNYDLILQSDYQPILPLNIVAPRIVYVNYEGISLRHRPKLIDIVNKFIYLFS